VLPDPVDARHIRLPSNDSERLLFRHLFGTLIHLDCNRRASPGLAESWSPDASHRVWTFTLRDGDRPGSTGTVTAPEIVSSWQEASLWPNELGVDSALALDERRIAVFLRAASDSVPKVLADPFFSAVSRGAAAQLQQPEFQIQDSSLPAIRFLRAPGSDPRDAIDRGAGLMITHDPALVDYAANRRETATTPLPWSRTYVLLQMPGIAPLEQLTADSVRSSLARDAVPAFARPAEPPYWWVGLTCAPDSTRSLAQPLSPRIVYLRSDEAARALAERVVALYGRRLLLRSAGLDETDLANAVRSGAERGYVIGLPHETLAPCRELPRLPAGTSILPLIDTRAQAIVRRGSPELTVDFDGTVRVVGVPGRAEHPQ
jgi:hypothetical protein